MLIFNREVDLEMLYVKYGEKEKVTMIKEVREQSGCGLKEAKDIVDAYLKQRGSGKQPEEVKLLDYENNDSSRGKEDGLLIEMVGANGILSLYENRIKIKRRGLRGVLGHGIFEGEKEIFLSSITGIQLRKAGFVTVGYIQFTILGGNEGKRGLTEATTDENTVTFDSPQQKIAEQIRDKIYELQRKASTPVVQNVVQQCSGADEILKYKQLLDAGILTQEEFELKKKQILGM